ncbi:MAG: hypothetical protein GY714_18770 [Desulfobacterales bacterium]|nr:hypothetical protein [Desulfobacterales bacterium]MCP4160673.1 hypothetical protein [Deltaproteobacteria bacterium]
MKEIFKSSLKKNGIDKEWYFKDGMNFRDNTLWWGECKKRTASHEGIDFGYVIGDDGICNINEDFIVSNFLDGSIIKVIDDFIGKSVFVKHEIFNESKELFSIFGHVKTQLEEGPIGSFDNIGTISTRKNIPVHFHYSLVWIPEKTSFDLLAWDKLNSNESVLFIDPKSFKMPK